MANSTELKIINPKLTHLYQLLAIALHENDDKVIGGEADNFAKLTDDETVALACYRRVLPELSTRSLSGMQLAMLLRNTSYCAFFVRIARLPTDQFSKIDMAGDPSSNNISEKIDILNYLCRAALAGGTTTWLDKFLEMPQAAFAKLNFNEGSYEADDKFDGPVLLKACKLATRKHATVYIVDYEKAKAHFHSLPSLPLCVVFYLKDNSWHYQLRLPDEQERIVEHLGKVVDICGPKACQCLENLAESNVLEKWLVVKDNYEDENDEDDIAVIDVADKIIARHGLSPEISRPQLLQKIFDLPESAIHRLCLDLTTLPESSVMVMFGKTKEKMIYEMMLAGRDEADFVTFYLKLSLEQLNFLDSVMFYPRHNQKDLKRPKTLFQRFPTDYLDLHEFALALKTFLKNLQTGTNKDDISSQITVLITLVELIRDEDTRNKCYASFANYFTDLDDIFFQEVQETLLKKITRASPQFYSDVAHDFANRHYNKSVETLESRLLNLQQALICALDAFSYQKSADNIWLIKKIAITYLLTRSENFNRADLLSDAAQEKMIDWLDPLFEKLIDENEMRLAVLILPRLNVQRMELIQKSHQQELKQLTAENTVLKSENEQLRLELARLRQSTQDTQNETSQQGEKFDRNSFFGF